MNHATEKAKSFKNAGESGCCRPRWTKIVTLVQPTMWLAMSFAGGVLLMFSGVETPPAYWTLGVVTGVVSTLAMVGGAMKGNESPPAEQSTRTSKNA